MPKVIIYTLTQIDPFAHRMRIKIGTSTFLLSSLLVVGCSSSEESAYIGPRFIGPGAMGASGLPSAFSMSEMQSTTSTQGAEAVASGSKRYESRTQTHQTMMSDQLKSVYQATQVGEKTITVSVEE